MFQLNKEEDRADQEVEYMDKEKKVLDEGMERLPRNVLILATLLLVCSLGFLFWKVTGSQIEADKDNFSKEKAPVATLKTIDFLDTYSVNDLDFTYVILEEGEKKLKYPQLVGLKNQQIQTKINNELAKIAEKTWKEALEFEAVYIENGSVWGNFSNLLSINFAYSYEYDDPEGKRRSKYVNYPYNVDLTTGDEIQFADLFISEEEAKEALRKMIYGSVYSQLGWGVFGEGAELDEEILNINRQLGPLDEIKFVLTPTHININELVSGLGIYTKLELYKDQLAIYDRYLTKDSIFEKSIKSNENIMVFTSPMTELKYSFKSKVSDNLYLDVGLYSWLDFQFPEREKYIKPMEEDILSVLKPKVPDYITFATQNPDKGTYFTYFAFGSSNGEYMIYQVDFYETKMVIPISEYQEAFPKLVAFERSKIGGVEWGSGISLEELFNKMETKNESFVYNLETGELLNSVADYFVEGFDYSIPIKESMKADLQRWEMPFDEETVNQLYQKGKLDMMNGQGVSLEVIDKINEENSRYFIVNFNQFDEENLKIKRWKHE